MDKSATDAKNGHTYIQWIIALTANLTLFTYGLQAGWISPMTKYLQSNNSPTGVPLTTNEISWVASTLCISAVFGVPFYAYIVDKYGRKAGLIGIAVPQAICWILKLSTASTLGLIFARVFCGLAAGGCFNVIPLYVKEISQDNIRGLLGSLLILLQNTGVLCMYAMGAYLEYNTVLWVVVGLPIVNVIMLLKTPESPAYLVKIGEVEKAVATIGFLRGLKLDDKTVQNEVDTIKNEHFYYQSLPNFSFCSIFTVPPWRRTFIVLLVMMTVQSCNGAFALVTYAATILSRSGVTFSPELQTLSFPTLMIVSSLVSMNCIEKLGRKPVLVLTSLLSFLALSTLSSFLILQESGYAIPTWMIVFCMIVVVTSYAGGVSPIPYVLMSEMFNFQIRAKAIGCIVTEAWFMSFVQLVVFGPLTNTLGLHMTFFVFAAINLCGFIVSLTCIPETKAKTVEEIELLMSGKKL